jgi:Domain of unknown function (DUF4188)
MYITITYVKLKKRRYFFILSYRAMKITLQTRKEKGFLQMKNTGWGYMHYTVSAWESPEDLKRFSRQGAHLDAMKKSNTIASEVGTYTYSGDSLPDWKTAKEMVHSKAKIVTFS